MKAQKTRDVLKHLKGAGWIFLRDGKGSHEIWGRPDESEKATIPAGHREVSAWVLAQIEKSTSVEWPGEWR